MARLVILPFVTILTIAMRAWGFEPRVCPPGINDTPALPVHFAQADILRMPFPAVFAAGQRLFVTDFNVCDGAGRPGTTGGVKPRTPDPALGPRFTRISGPDANSCAGCHNQPQPAGAGDFVANVFVLAQNATPVSGALLSSDFTQTWLERNTLGMFGAGAIELLGREMTQDLVTLRSQAITRAGSLGADVRVPLVTKGVSFGFLTAHADGSVDTGAVVGVDADLIIKPFSRKGMMRSVREFTVNAFNQHHGMQAVERFGENTDPDGDGVGNELLVGDVTAASIFQAALPVPVQAPAESHRGTAERGRRLFGQVGCLGATSRPCRSRARCSVIPIR
jgi:hypothetical protein